MKRTIFFIFIMFTVVNLSTAQSVTDADFISPMNENMSAVKKGSQWAFINSEGKKVIDYRDDLVVSKTENGNYPIFENGRCLITQNKDGIMYFGYIDTLGKKVIEPQYLNAINFQNNHAIVLLLKRTVLSKNTALDKPVVSYDYFEVVIDPNGKVLTYLTEEPTHITLSPSTLKKTPSIYSKVISDGLFAVMNSQKKWSVATLPQD